MKTYKTRDTVPSDYKWDLTDFYKTEKDFDNEYKNVEKNINDLDTNCFVSGIALYQFLSNEINILNSLYNLYAYAHLKHDEILGNSDAIIRKNKIENLINEFNLKTAFFSVELLKIDRENYNKFFVEEARLSEFKVFLDNIFRDKDFVLTENEEKIISSMCNAVDHYEDMSQEIINSEHNYGIHTLSDGTKEELCQTNLRKFLKDPNQKVRKKAYESFYKKIEEYSSTNAGLLNSFVSLNNSISKIRGFKSSWDKKLFALNLPNSVYESLVSTVEDNLSYLHNYYKLKKEVLGLKTLNVYDLNLELSKSNKKYSIEEAQNILLEAVKPLGEDYQKHFKKIYDNHYVDYCQYKGKCSGGYSLSTLDHDSRILMSWNYDLDSVSTLAHEGGHNVHGQYVNENNPYQYRDITNLVAEIASLTNEFLLSDYLVKNGQTKEEKLSGLANIIGVINSNLFGAVREAKIEEDFYEYELNGNAITKDYLDKVTYDSLKKYYGSSVKISPLVKNTWVTRSHYYMNFYLYNYAICVSTASCIAKEIINGNKEMLDKYISFLKTGEDVWPIDSFNNLGIDITKKDVYQNAIDYYNELINKFKKIYNEKEV